MAPPRLSNMATGADTVDSESNSDMAPPEGWGFCLRMLCCQDSFEQFEDGGVADIKVDRYEADQHLAAMKRALVAHDALCRMLSQVEVPAENLPTKLWNAIHDAQRLGLITQTQLYLFD